MTDRELKKLRRDTLLEMMLKQQEELEQLREQLQEAEEKIRSQETELHKLSSIAEGALKLSKIYETAQASAEAYVEKIEKEKRDSENRGLQLYRSIQNWGNEHQSKFGNKLLDMSKAGLHRLQSKRNLIIRKK